MKKYSVIAFDLDGTLTDPAEGLVSGFVYAFRKLKIDYGEREGLKRFIGPSLFDAWQAEFGFTPEQSRHAIDVFREYYNVYGWRENKVYDGIYELLSALRDRGYKLIVATSKPEVTAKRVLELFDLTKYFDFIGGACFDPSRDQKHKVLKYALDSIGLADYSRAILVGDRVFDAEGARLVGIDSLGVAWGHGSLEELKSSGFVGIANTPSDVLSFFEKH